MTLTNKCQENASLIYQQNGVEYISDIDYEKVYGQETITGWAKMAKDIDLLDTDALTKRVEKK